MSVQVDRWPAMAEGALASWGGTCTVCGGFVGASLPGMARRDAREHERWHQVRGEREDRYVFRCGARQEPAGCQSHATRQAPCGAWRCAAHMPEHLAACNYRGRPAQRLASGLQRCDICDRLVPASELEYMREQHADGTALPAVCGECHGAPVW